jgi:hypothetical protein
MNQNNIFLVEIIIESDVEKNIFFGKNINNLVTFNEFWKYTLISFWKKYSNVRFVDWNIFLMDTGK